MSEINKKHILIIAGESSGDLHGAGLVRAIKNLDQGIAIRGIGGKKMEESGVEIIYPYSDLAVVGLIEVFSKLPQIIRAYGHMRHFLKYTRPDLLILIDFPDFNISLARTAKRCKVPVLYYISPQLWAWRRGRVRKIARRVDKMAVILPFEKEFYLDTGEDIDVDYVGHPIMDAVPEYIHKDMILGDLGLEKEGPVLGILPGSRTEEIKNLLPSMIGAAEILSSRYKEMQFILNLAPTIPVELVQSFISKTSIKVVISQQDIYSSLSVCDLALVASGTATLETALMGVPMVIAYRVSPLSFKIGKMAVKVPYVGLVNLIAGEEIVPEVLQDEVTPEALAERASMIIDNDAYRQEIIMKLGKIRERIGGRGASERTARIAMGMINHMSRREA